MTVVNAGPPGDVRRAVSARTSPAIRLGSWSRLTATLLVTAGLTMPMVSAAHIVDSPALQRATTPQGSTAKPPQTAAPADQRGGRSDEPRRNDETRRNDGPPRPGTPNWFAPWEWWTDEDVKKELGLSEAKAARIGQIFKRRESQMRPYAEAFEKEALALEKMTRERLADESAYAFQVGKVEATLVKLRESRTIMLYSMYLELTPEQHKKLQDIRDRRSRNGRGSSPSKSH